jgi:predicted transcriptional regulator of viral defense system
VGEAATALATASRRFEWEKVADYLKRIGSGAFVRRFGWPIMPMPTPPEIRERLTGLTGGGTTRARLGPPHHHTVPNAIGYDKTWRLFVNVPREELHGSAGLGRRKPVKKKA